MLKHIFADVRFNNGKRCKIYKGSHQGGILSPLIFNLYIKGCIEDIVNHDVGCKIGLIKMECIILCRWYCSHGLQKLIDILS